MMKISTERFKALYRVYMYAHAGNSKKLTEAIATCRRLENAELSASLMVGIPANTNSRKENVPTQWES